MMPSEEQTQSLSLSGKRSASHVIDSDGDVLPPWLEALKHPFRRGWWWLGMALSIWMLLDMGEALVNQRPIHQYKFRGAICCIAVIIRCYMVTVETTLTNYGDKEWQTSAYDSSSEGQSFGEVLCVFVTSLAPAGAWFWAAALGKVAVEPWGTLLIAIGCCYFCMGLIGVAFYGGVQGASPFIVLPALCRIGYPFLPASCALALVPWMLRGSLMLDGSDSQWLRFIASTAAGYLLISHARLITLLYLDNRSRVGWE